ncbi:MAG: GntR family transcriptional regulator [Bacteroidota bacterium]
MNSQPELPIVKTLFMQIKELIEARIRAGEWAQGENLPSEFDFAAYYKVSQGTVRKSINLLAEEKIVERIQGKGTYVKSITDENEHSHYFHIMDKSGEKAVTSSIISSISKNNPNNETQKLLNMDTSQEVIVAERIRIIHDKPAVIEKVYLTDKDFPDIYNLLSDKMPHELYPLYESSYGIKIISAKERLTAVSATKAQAKTLSVEVGSPLLKIMRTAYTFNNNPVELRISYFSTANFYYLSELT